MSIHDDQDNRDVSLLAIDQYLRWVSSIPAMSLEEEQRLLACVEQGVLCLESCRLHGPWLQPPEGFVGLLGLAGYGGALRHIAANAALRIHYCVVVDGEVSGHTHLSGQKHVLAQH